MANKTLVAVFSASGVTKRVAEIRRWLYLANYVNR